MCPILKAILVVILSCDFGDGPFFCLGFVFLRKEKERFVALLFKATKCQFLQPFFFTFLQLYVMVGGCSGNMSGER